MRITAILTFLAVMAIPLGGCGSNGGGSDGGTAGPGVVGSLQVVATPSTEIQSAGGDAVVLTAIVKDGSNILMEGVDVSFSANNNGTLVVNRGTTDSTGTAEASLNASGDTTNRTITVTISAGARTTRVDIQVVGTAVSVTGPSSVELAQTVELTLAVKDSSGNGIPGRTLSISSALRNGVPTSQVTDANGEVKINYLGTNPGSDSLTVVTTGATSALFPIQVSNVVFRFDDPLPPPAPVAEVNLGDSRNLSLYWPSGIGETITFASTRGTLSATSAVVDGTGHATISISSNTSGQSTITARNNAQGLVNSINILFVATTPASMTLQSNPSSIVVTPPGSTTPQQSQIIAVVRDPAQNLVKGKTVQFNLNDPTGGWLSAASSITDQYGEARVVYTSGPSPSQYQGITVNATVEPPYSSVSASTFLTVGGEALFITIGTGNTITEPTNTTYQVPYSVLVTDSNGSPKPGATVTLTILPVGYYTGYWVKTYTPAGSFSRWEPEYILSRPVPPYIPNEDLDYDGTLDPGEDVNGNGQLDPGNIATFNTVGGSTQTTVTTKANGFADFNIAYLQEYGTWVIVKIVATAKVGGTESTRTAQFTLPIVDSDVISEILAPPGYPDSPYGP